jgi:8-amino-7-oxononanoate synthase
MKGNVMARKAALHLQQNGYDVRAILSPTVPKGQERLRICLHAHNTKKEIRGLLKSLKVFADKHA